MEPQGELSISHKQEFDSKPRTPNSATEGPLKRYWGPTQVLNESNYLNNLRKSAFCPSL